MSDEMRATSLILFALLPLEAGAQQPVTTAPGEALAEIVITAQRRTEHLDQVPVAATVIAGTELAKHGVASITDLPTMVPNLMIQTQGPLSYVNIRGVGIQTTNPTTSSGVANYSDGFFIPHEFAINDGYYDVGQIEVLRGPQGTLVGQSSTGGALFVNAVRPSFERITGYVQQAFGNLGYLRTEGAINLPLSEHVAVRFAMHVDHTDSFYNSIAVGGAPSNGLEPGKKSTYGGRLGLRFEPASSVEVYLKYELEHRTGDGFIGKSYAELAGASDAADPRLSGPFTISYDFPGSDSYRMWRTSAEINWHLSDTLVLRSLTGYQHEESENRFDNDFTFLPISSAIQRLRENTFQQEINLISSPVGGLNWILGAFYLRDSVPTFLQLTVPPTILIQTQPYEKSYAAFGEASYTFADKWRLSVGARQNRNEKTSAGTQELVGFPFPPVDLAAQIDKSNLTGKLSLSYLPDQDSSIYLSASRGFKAGGANPSNSVNFIFKPETINAYEAGYKATILNQRFRVASALYYYDYKDLQTTVFDPIARQAIINVPSSRIYGAEFEVSAQAGPLQFSLGAGYNESEVDETLVVIDARNPFAGPQDVKGRQLSYAPTWTANAGVRYAAPISVGTIAATAQYLYVGRAYTSLFQNVPTDVLDSHSLINLTLTLRLNNKLQFEAYGVNLADRRYSAATIGSESAIWGAPRQYGVRISYDF